MSFSGHIPNARKCYIPLCTFHYEERHNPAWKLKRVSLHNLSLPSFFYAHPEQRLALNNKRNGDDKRAIDFFPLHLSFHPFPCFSLRSSSSKEVAACITLNLFSWLYAFLFLQQWHLVSHAARPILFRAISYQVGFSETSTTHAIVPLASALIELVEH